MIIWAKQVPAFWSGLQNIHFFILFHLFRLFPCPSHYRGSSLTRRAQHHLPLVFNASLLTLVCRVQFSLAPWVTEHTTSGQLRHTVLWQRGYWWKIELHSKFRMYVNADYRMLHYAISPGLCSPSLLQLSETVTADQTADWERFSPESRFFSAEVDWL